MKFQVFTAKFDKQYANQEEREFRMQLFEQVDQFIEGWNANEQRTHTVGHNEFSDWTEDERAKMRGFKMYDANAPLEVSEAILTIPDSIDWRDTGAVTPV